MLMLRTAYRLAKVLTLQISITKLCYTANLQPVLLQQQYRPMASNQVVVTQDFNYFLVLDFEATCIRNGKLEPQEIIEFPVLKVNGKSFETEATFHTYVQPTVHKVSQFCTELTGITQAMVDGQPTVQETLKNFDDWMHGEGLFDPNCKSVFVTCGDWDLKTMLQNQCQHFDIKAPNYFSQWINIKKPYAAVTGHFPKGMMSMLHHLDIEHEGKHHSGIDDCKNIAKILAAIARRSYKFTITGSNKRGSESSMKVTRGSRHGRAYKDSDT